MRRLLPVLFLLACDKTGPATSADPAPTTPPAAIADTPVEGAAAAPGEAEAPAADATPATATAGATTEADEGDDPPEHAAVPPERKVLVLGSSLAATAFGNLLATELDGAQNVSCERFAKSATGLSRPDFFDWMEAAKKQVEAHDPDVTIVVMGGNDGQDLTEAKGKGRVRWDSDGWADGYRQRVDELTTLLAGEDRHVIWLGVPRTNTTNLEGKLAKIREIYEAGAEAHPRATYVALTHHIEKEDGSLMREVKIDGKFRTLRGKDGVHFTMAGSRYLAETIAPELLEIIRK